MRDDAEVPDELRIHDFSLRFRDADVRSAHWMCRAHPLNS
jgi:hypothetical protein